MRYNCELQIQSGDAAEGRAALLGLPCVYVVLLGALLGYTFSALGHVRIPN